VVGNLFTLKPVCFKNSFLGILFPITLANILNRPSRTTPPDLVPGRETVMLSYCLLTFYTDNKMCKCVFKCVRLSRLLVGF